MLILEENSQWIDSNISKSDFKLFEDEFNYKLAIEKCIVLKLM